MGPVEGAPTIEHFDAEPGGGLSVGGGPVTLSWTVTNADTVSIDQGIGQVDGAETTAEVSKSTIFTLTATNSQGSAEASTVALVASDGPPAIDRSAPNAADQIDEALALGDIDDVTALRYKVFALHGDDRLPPEFDADGPVHGSPILFELARRFDGLPSEVQDEMRPFLLRPDDPNSWYAARKLIAKAGTSSLFDDPVFVADGRVCIQWPSSFTDAQKLFSRIVIGRAAARSYRALTELMGRSPLGNGDDPDVYTVYVLSTASRSALGWTRPTSETPDGRWRSHATINLHSILNSVSDSELLASDLTSATVAHELLHGIQFSYNTAVEIGGELQDEAAPLTWLAESTATWAEHFVYPGLDTEQIFLPSFFKRPFISLDDLRGTHEYAGYLFHLYLTEGLNNPALIPAFWEAAERLPVFAGMDEALGGQLVNLFTEFAVANWNAGHIRDYQIWDNIEDGVSGGDEGSPVEFINPNRTVITSFPLDREDDGVIVGPSLPGVRSLSAQYWRFTFEDENTRSLLFANGFNYDLRSEPPTDLPVQYDGNEFYVPSESFTEILDRNTRTHILVKNQGEWSGPYDLTTVPFVAFCQDLPEERVEELVFIFTNGNFEEGQRASASARGLRPALLGSNIACGRWEGTAAGTETATPAPGNPDFTLLQFSEVTFNKMVFSRVPVPLEKLVEGVPTTLIGNYLFSAFLTPSYQLTLTDAEAEWTVTFAESSPGQSCSGDGSLTLGETQLFGSLWTFNHFLPDHPDYRTHLIDVGPFVDLTYDVTCTAGGGGQNSETFGMSNLNGESLPIEDDGVSIQGAVESMTNAGSATYLELWSWAFSAKPAQSSP
jgi:hypothetical protein